MAVYNFLNEDKSRIFFGDGLGSNIFTYESRQDLTRKQIGGISTQEDYLKKFTLGKIIQNIGVIGFLLLCLLLLMISIYSYNLASDSSISMYFIYFLNNSSFLNNSMNAKVTNS